MYNWKIKVFYIKKYTKFHTFKLETDWSSQSHLIQIFLNVYIWIINTYIKLVL